MRAWSNTQNHNKVLRSRTRNSHTLPHKLTTRTPFSPNRKRKRCKGYHFAQAAKRHRAQTTKPRQGPPPGPQPPDPPFRSRRLAKAGPGGRGCACVLTPAPAPNRPFWRGPGGPGAGYVWAHQPRPSLVQLNDIATNQKHSYVSRPQAHHAAPGGGGLPLPAAAAAAPF